MKKNLCAIVSMIVLFAGCSNPNAWMENTEALYQWRGNFTGTEGELYSVQEYVDLFLDAHEETLDYGMAYITTLALCEDMELCEVLSNISEEELGKYFSDAENLYLLDFTMPMFETYFFEEDIVGYVKAAAVSMEEFMCENMSTKELYELCVTASDEEIKEIKNDWLESIGVCETYEPHTIVVFERNNGEKAGEYPYVLHDSEANWYFHPGDVKEYGYKAFVEEYLITEELMVQDFPEARELFENFLPEEVPTIDICTMFYKQSGPEGGVYKTLENHIELYYSWETAKYALLHEYAHYLTMGESAMIFVEGALAEGVAEEAAIWGCENRLRAEALSSIYDVKQMQEVELYDDEKGCINYEKIAYSVANSMYAGVLEGMEYFTVTYDLRERPKKVETLAALSYEEMASLTHYLVELYGRDAVYEGFYNYDSFMKLVGKDFAELYDEWGTWNKEQCDKLGLEFIYE